MNKNMIILFVIALGMFPGKVMALEGQRAEFSIGGGSFVDGESVFAFGAASIGATYKFVGLEFNGAYLGGTVVVGANLLVGAFKSKNISPYVTGGGWTTLWGGFGFNAGVGLKAKLSKTSALRIEFRRYYFHDAIGGINSIVIGHSTYF